MREGEGGMTRMGIKVRKICRYIDGKRYEGRETRCRWETWGVWGTWRKRERERERRGAPRLEL